MSPCMYLVCLFLFRATMCQARPITLCLILNMYTDTNYLYWSILGHNQAGKQDYYSLAWHVFISLNFIVDCVCYYYFLQCVQPVEITTVLLSMRNCNSVRYKRHYHDITCMYNVFSSESAEVGSLLSLLLVNGAQPLWTAAVYMFTDYIMYAWELFKRRFSIWAKLTIVYNLWHCLNCIVWIVLFELYCIVWIVLPVAMQ